MRMRALHPDPARGPGLHATDVDVDAGVAVGVLRPLLARLTGWAGWAAGDGRLAVGDRVLTGDHPAGVAPLLPGAVLRPTSSHGGPDPLLVAAHEAHVAVVAGPDAGHVAPLPRGAAVVASRRGAGAARGAAGPSAAGGPASVAGAPATRARRGARGAAVGPSWLVLDDPALPVVEVARRGRVVVVRIDGGLSRPWRADRPMRAGNTTFVLRRPDGRRPRRRVRAQGRAGTAGSHAGAWHRASQGVPAQPPERLAPAPRPRRRALTVWLVPLAGSVALGLATHELWLALTGLLMPLSSVLTSPRDPADRGHRRRRPRDVPGAPDLPALAVATALAAAGQAAFELDCAGGRVAGPTGVHDAAALPRLPRGTADGAPAPAATGASDSAPGAPATDASVGVPRGTAALPPPPTPADPAMVRTGARPSRVRVPAPWDAGGARPPLVRVAAPWDPAGSLAVVGPREHARAAARAIALGALGSDGASTLAIRTDDPCAWSWAAWLTPPDAALPGPSHGPAVVVVDMPLDPLDPLDPTVAAWRATAPPEQLLVLLAPRGDLVPSWCTSAVHAEAPPAASAGRPHGRAPATGVSRAWADAQARRLAAVRHHASRRATAAADSLPSGVALGDLPDVPSAVASAVARSWSAGVRPVPLGVGTGGRVVTVDLRRDGPHALVAGTTGAGKSALLASLVLAHALAEPPERLAVLLVDFKGGAGLGPVAGLPHVLDHVTDLDAARARRVLVGLAAELRRRESLLARGGVTDLAGLDADRPDTPPRLLVVVDELRALADDVPDAMPTLARLAAQGRALGVHLVLATQRPAGAVPADLRANLGLRICLRVADAADSTDVLDDPVAARIDPALPGRALLRVAGGPLVPFQTARAATDAQARVRRAPPWAAPHAWTPPRPEPEPGAQPWIEAARTAATGRPTRSTPWLPELPRRVLPGDVPAGTGLPVALADLPDEQRRAAVRWDPSMGHLLVVGGPGSGRTTALVAIAGQAGRAGSDVHAIGLAPRDAARLHDVVPTARLGSVLPADEPVAVARLLDLLAATTASTVLLVDGLDVLLDELADLARGAAAARLIALLRRNDGELGVAAATAATPSGLRHAAAFRSRLVLALPDDAAALAGVPRDLASGLRGPGRAVHLHGGPPALCQLALPDPLPRDAPARPAQSDGVPRVRPLPARARRPRARSGRGPAQPVGRVAVGVGGDTATEVALDLREPRLVAGPPGSGRSTALDVIAAGAARAGVVVVRLAPGDRPHPAAADTRQCPSVELRTSSADRAAALLAARPDALLVVDDLDELERTHESVAALVASRRRRLIVATTAHAAVVGAHREPLASLLRARRLLVLAPHDGASAELIGPRAAWLADPRGCPPGRAALVDGRAVVPVQVYG
ncbi:FtsK/SpoIIIE domain-containing protein [Cellulomonas alba]|uniref:FtsK/SpoIIIE domain-containing protein n=1 Tax=Cellulomonas alba TaxID=3053467 RepID=A0ABT7SD03_9CELL|nr:FtsK/SpoIIIE domain-containing protein [Cellulomonas alba]MDM7854058.1 FtsK/SpoIIIE domain-containing protein [Cellulomonas alba]